MRLLGLVVASMIALTSCAGQGKTSATVPLKVLVVTATQGFRHEEAIVASRDVLKKAESTAGMTFDFTEDLSTLNPANLAQYDVLFLNNCTLRIAPLIAGDSASIRAAKLGRTPATNLVTKDQRDAIAGFVRGGKGLVAVHAGMDALYGWQEYREITGGGLFLSHPFTRDARVMVEDQGNASVSHFGPSVNFMEEYYYLDVNPRNTSHVLTSLDLTSVNDTTKTDHPLSFIRRYGQGRVYVNLLGHFGDTWRRPDYITGLLQGIRIAAGRVPADFSVKSR